MATVTSLRNKLDTKVFTKLGTTATVASVDTNVVDKWGDGSVVYSAGASASCVPYDYVTDRLNYQPFGTLSENDVVFVFRYDTVLDVDYKITYSGTEYLVVEIEEYPYSGSPIAKLVRAAKIL